MSSIPITTGTGQASVATEQIGTVQFQQIKVIGGEVGSTSVMGVNPDRSISVSVIGSPTVTFSGSPSVSGTVGASIVGQLPGGTAVLGSVAALQGTNPWTIVGSVYGSGSVVSFQGGTQITSIVNSIPSSVLVGASIFGQLPAGTAPLGSVAVLQGTNPWVIVGSVYSFGSVVAFQGGTQMTSITNIIPSSVLVGASIFGQLPAGTAVLGSVATLQGTQPWINTNVGSIITIQLGSVITVPISSTIAVLQSPSIVGTYAEDSAHTSGDKGVFMLTVRNDTLASITSADADYSPVAVGPMGEAIIANAPITKWVSGTADLRGASTGGPSVAVIAAQGASVFTYITGLQVVNMGSASVLVTLSGATSSVVGYTIAPAGGGSNIVYPNALRTNANAAFAASISGIASVLISAQGFIAKT